MSAHGILLEISTGAPGALMGVGRWLLTLSMALFVAYLCIIVGALVLAWLRDGARALAARMPRRALRERAS